jgi:membrane protease YdiL (CAAX protease family)
MNSFPGHGLDQEHLDPEPEANLRPPDVSLEQDEVPAPDAPLAEQQEPIVARSPVIANPYLDPESPQRSEEAQPLDQPLFQSWSEPEMHAPVRIPHLGHVAILGIFALCGLLGASLLIRSALHFHLFGITQLQDAITDIHYTLGSEVVLYVLMFGCCVLFFPLIWHQGLFTGLHWNGGVALRLRSRLFVIASVCSALALINGLLLPSPTDAPIDKIFRVPGAAWLLFGFGVTFAPFFEEMVFRGFLLPALCTAFDWIYEKSSGAPARPLDLSGQPQWSFNAMVFGSIATSLPFAAMHGAQTSYSWGPFVLLVGVSLVLCWARLSTRSLAASVFVHASYNFLLFSLMMLGTGGFRHLDKM